MGPKSKGKPKCDWSFCSLTGIGFHSSDSAAHTSLLDSSANSPTETRVDFPHIYNSTFKSSVVVGEEKLGNFSSRIEQFNSVYLPSFVASSCNIGFSSLVLVSCPRYKVVLRAYPHSKQDNKLFCSPGSWLESLHDGDDLVTVERFTDRVANASEAELRLKPEVEGTDVLQHARAFLGNKVLFNGISVPFRYFGKSVQITVLSKDKTDHSFLSDDSLLEDLGNISISENLTSTPHKAVQMKTKYFVICSSTKLLQRIESELDNMPFIKIGGLEKQQNLLIESINSIFTNSSRKCVNGILLYGPPGVGKTLLALNLRQKIRSNFKLVAGPELYSKFYGESENKIRELFEEAERLAPTVLVLDELDSLAPRRDGEGNDQEKRVVATLQTCLDKLQMNQSRVAVIGTTSRVEGISPTLRRPGRLDLEVEVGVPGPEDRLQILEVYLDQSNHALSVEDIKAVAQETHGFVGADLSSLYGTAMLAAQESESDLNLTHFRSARSLVKPSAMREVQVEIPTVCWDDIGGLDDLKLKLNQAVDWPIRHPEVFIRMGIKPPRGVLMYGPPGCSKTMIAKALANESGLNFLSIKGPELFSKWVGESEKAVRELFRRARAVAPSIVFFDEIDALGGARGEGGSKVGERVLAQLLTEMDGVESLVGVTVLAATNRPDMMDRALLRPGRLDRVIYVPLPDLDTRRQVLRIHSARIPVRGVNTEEIAERTEGYSGAELAAVCNEAALAALEENSDANFVTENHFAKALIVIKPRIQNDLLRIYDEFRKDHDKS